MKKIINTLLLILIVNVSNSQSIAVAGVKSIYSNGLGTLTYDGQVQGYYFFYMSDKVSEDFSNYELILYNNVLDETHNIKITKPNKTSLIEASFNGNRLSFLFVNSELKTIELDIYDMEGQKTASYLDNNVSPSEISYYGSALSGNDFSGILIPVKNKGFIRYRYRKLDGYRAFIEFINNKGVKVWETEPFSNEKKSFEITDAIFTNERVVISNISTRPKMISSDLNMNMIAHDVKNGKELFRFPLENDQSFQVVMGVNYDDTLEQYMVYGESYGKTSSGKMNVKNKIGFFIQIYSEEGELVNEKYSNWENDIVNMLSEEDREKLKEDPQVFIHTVIKTADGNYFAIGEQFKKDASAKALASKAIGNQTSVMEIVLMDMIVFKFDKNLKLQSAKFIKKELGHVQLPSGYSTASVDKLGYYIKVLGQFDYAFTTRSKDQTTFNSVYTTYIKDKSKKEKKADVGVIYYQDKEINVDHIILDVKTSGYVIIPAKIGYITILEYNNKEKTAEFRLEKLDI